MATAPIRNPEEAQSGQICEQSLGAEAILTELRAGLCAIDNRFDSLLTILASMSCHLDKQQSCLESAEGRVSAIEDDTESLRKRLEKVEGRLKTVAIKQEDLEVRGHLNNLRIARIAECYNTGQLDVVVEKLLTYLLRHQGFTSNFEGAVVILKQLCYYLGPEHLEWIFLEVGGVMPPSKVCEMAYFEHEREDIS
ncbi:hypothetical protein NDU88_003826 [Pleurodeles waltl]|uniref:Uncharacterized protein n=1 Tax=Pleurodeles waltl TaxID=8319 RepID=A0AAV7PDY2_PLEWA|nr:hypothetical protein NDU88_003826 [Pleurodeles waltl]